ncbi:hypothetical protein SAMN05216556_107140 [Aequorivita viscosa]|uniref:Uncharacterized protein n=1 Tax=Aequorivita viscosa TaxID=797419 RepID=A0A1M6K8S9_9FLAO|nr:hypothetical protein SAMN05216556_107140 [Aequorivita viscosa]SHJ55352.1 hypothetical protein SAMN04487908_11963 [Aequorivita viscosa]
MFVERFVKPFLEVYFHKEIQSDKGHQIGQVPFVFCHCLERFQHQDGYQRCPYLYHHRILVGAYERFYVQELFDVPVKFAYRVCCPRHLVGNKLNFLLVFIVPHYDPSHLFRIFLFGFNARELDNLVQQNVLVPILGKIVCLYRVKLDVLLVSNHEKHLVAVPDIQQGKIIVKTVGNNNASFDQGNLVGSFVVVGLPIGDVHVSSQVPVIVEQGVHFHRPFCGLVLGPVEQAQAKAYGGGVQQEYLGLYPEFHPLSGSLLSKTFQQRKVIILKNLSVADFVLVADGRF